MASLRSWPGRKRAHLAILFAQTICEEGMLMYLRTLDVRGFKCFEELFSIELHDGLNVLVGENGAGKTGVVSAIRQLFNDSESQADYQRARFP
ncbi:AAA family ATPase [Pseudomonas viridiflava]|nr:AAA family ATPase [Pseudomonas viridiflava]MEE4017344.1 AAA family ATPase [Pseudomonas viridiflava]